MENNPFGVSLFTKGHKSIETLTPAFVKNLPDSQRNEIEGVLYNMLEDIKCLHDDVAALGSFKDAKNEEVVVQNNTAVVEGKRITLEDVKLPQDTDWFHKGETPPENQEMAEARAAVYRDKVILDTICSDRRVLTAHLNAMPVLTFKIVSELGDKELQSQTRDCLLNNQKSLQRILNEAQERQLISLCDLLNDDLETLRFLSQSNNVAVAKAAFSSSLTSHPELLEKEMKITVERMAKHEPVPAERLDMLSLLVNSSKHTT